MQNVEMNCCPKRGYFYYYFRMGEHISCEQKNDCTISLCTTETGFQEYCFTDNENSRKTFTNRCQKGSWSFQWRRARVVSSSSHHATNDHNLLRLSLKRKREFEKPYVTKNDNRHLRFPKVACTSSKKICSRGKCPTTGILKSVRSPSKVSISIIRTRSQMAQNFPSRTVTLNVASNDCLEACETLSTGNGIKMSAFLTPLVRNMQTDAI